MSFNYSNQHQGPQKPRNPHNEAIVEIRAGAGGDDAEDFSKMLLSMYLKYANKKGWGIHFIHEHKNEHGGYKNVSLEICESKASANVYGLLKNESGVHRLVRISPFNAKKLRHTSFSLVEVMPDLGEDEKLKLAQCLTINNAVFYRSATCPECDEQLDLFGNDAVKFLIVTNCASIEDCPDGGVPAWKIGTQTYYGVKKFDELISLSGCAVDN